MAVVTESSGVGPISEAVRGALGTVVAPETKWKTVCNGHQYWSAFQKIPRKCTQSTVKMSDCGTKVLKEHKSSSWYRKEKNMLQKLSAHQSMQGLVPELVSYDNSKNQLVLSNCGNPIKANKIPDHCRSQVRICAYDMRKRWE
jgi:hypothetical protein